jgi:hypothetical protein
MVSANITSTTAANFIPEVWAGNTLDAVEFATMWAKLVNREYEGEIKAYGDTVHIPHVSNYTALTKSSGIANTIDFESMTHSKTDITIDTHKYAAFQVEKFAQKQALPGFVEKQTKKLGYALARAMDVSVAALPQNFADSIVGTYGVELTDTDYNSAWQKLAEAGVVEENSENGDVVIVLSPAAYAAALRTDRLVNRDYAGEDGANALRRAKMGAIYGSNVYMSNLCRAPSAGQHDNAWFHRNAMALACQAMPEVERDKIIEQLAEAVVVHTIYGVAELARPVETAGSVSTTDNFGVLLKSV